jgi:trehalose 6-phosphate phosphatase
VKDILAAPQRPLLERLASEPSLLAFDYDGVLAPVVKDPAGLPIAASTRAVLSRLAVVWPCAIVSGRAWSHTRVLSRGAVETVVGNHGFELGRARPVPRAILSRVAAWRAVLEEELAGQPVYYEDKRSTLAIHYGLQRRWHAVEQAVLRATARLTDARLVRGKKVLNVIPTGFPNKGDAIRALLAKQHLRLALYVGDDVTDEDAFAIGLPTVIGVRVGPGRSRAPYRLASQDRIDELLSTLLALRARAGRRAAR